MTSCFRAILCLLLVIIHRNGADEALKELTRAQNELGLNLYRKLSIPYHPNSNVVLSPLSIAIGLSMLLEGSDGKTANQLESALHLDSLSDNVEWQETSRRLLQSLDVGKSKTGNLTLALANRLFYEKNARVKQEFSDVLKSYFLAGIEGVDFAHKSDDVRSRINNWIEEQTMHKIKRMLPEEAIDSQTRFVLINALYMKSMWKTQFTLKKGVAPFYLSEGSTTQVQMMTDDRAFLYYHDADLKVTVVEVPYAVDSLKFVVVVPDERFGLEKVEARMDLKHLDDWLRSAKKYVSVALTLPRFRVESSFALKKVLKDLGVVDVFDTTKADLSRGFEDNRPLALTHVLHKVLVEVNENGTEAAVASAIVASNRMAAIPSLPVVADHPFLFFIVDRSSGALLFMGRLSNPSYEASSRMRFLDPVTPELPTTHAPTAIPPRLIMTNSVDGKGQQESIPYQKPLLYPHNLGVDSPRESDRQQKVPTMLPRAKYGATSLHLASRNGRIEKVEALLEDGANVNGVDNIGATPLHDASRFGHADIVTLLLDHGANVNAKREHGVTPLHEASLYGKYAIVKTLLEHGANSNLETSLGETPLDIAARLRHDAIVDLLESLSSRRSGTKKKTVGRGR